MNTMRTISTCTYYTTSDESECGKIRVYGDHDRSGDDLNGNGGNGNGNDNFNTKKIK